MSDRLFFSDGKFHAGNGNLLFLRGVNVRAYGAPRPFDLNNLSDHLKRIAGWGFNLVKFPVYWSELQKIPGKTNSPYLAYLAAVARACSRHNIYIIFSFQLDTLSGYPGWILEKAGIDTRALEKHDDTDGFIGSHLLGTMHTLFFKGSTLAPGLKSGGKSIQELLQASLIDSITALERKISVSGNLAGTEISGLDQGYIGLKRFDEIHEQGFGLSRAMTPFQKAYYSSGYHATIRHCILLNGHGFNYWLNRTTPQLSVWKNGCVWQRSGVWSVDQNRAPVLNHPDYFSENDFSERRNRFLEKLSAKIRWPLFFTAAPDAELPAGITPSVEWFDKLLGHTGRFFPKIMLHPFGSRLLAGNDIKDKLAKSISGKNMFVGKTGIRMDLHDRDPGLLKLHREQAFDRITGPLEQNLVSFCLNYYIPEESFASHPDNKYSLFAGYKNVTRTTAFSRPFAAETGGAFHSASHDAATGIFKYSFYGRGRAECRIFIPQDRYPDGITVIVNDGKFRYEPGKSAIFFRGGGQKLYGITVFPSEK